MRGGLAHVWPSAGAACCSRAGGRHTKSEMAFCRASWSSFARFRLSVFSSALEGGLFSFVFVLAGIFDTSCRSAVVVCCNLEQCRLQVSEISVRVVAGLNINII